MHPSDPLCTGFRTCPPTPTHVPYHATGQLCVANSALAPPARRTHLVLAPALSAKTTSGTDREAFGLWSRCSVGTVYFMGCIWVPPSEYNLSTVALQDITLAVAPFRTCFSYTPCLACLDMPPTRAYPINFVWGRSAGCSGFLTTNVYIFM